jgi:hypothetical protein
LKQQHPQRAAVYLSSFVAGTLRTAPVEAGTSNRNRILFLIWLHLLLTLWMGSKGGGYLTYCRNNKLLPLCVTYYTVLVFLNELFIKIQEMSILL